MKISMPLEAKQKKKLTNILDKFDVKDFKNNFSGIIMKAVIFFKKNKHNVKYLIPLSIVCFGVAIFFIVRTVNIVQDLNKQSDQLLYIDKFNTNLLKLNETAKKDLNSIKTIEDLINYQIEVKDEVVRYKEYLQSLQVPYIELLQYFYLPRLNIWKDPYLGSIDTNLIGKRFLENNPYNDILLLQQRSDFFKYVGKNNETNTITNISIGNINEYADGFFQLQVSVNFISHSKRSFLLLVDKLSLTSNETNIGLINEFMYYLWQEIKNNKQEELKEIAEQMLNKYQDNSSNFLTENENIDIDKIIGFHLYNQMENDNENILIDNKILLKTINNIVACDFEDQEKCLYEFREKYRTVPRLAYIFHSQVGINPVSNFHNFLQNFPPIISIQSFTFDKVNNIPGFNTNSQYEGKIVLNTYGKAVSDGEVEEIALLLGNKCFGDEIRLTPDVSKNIITKKAEKSASNNKVDSLQSSALRELKDIMEQLSLDYPKASNYEKIIHTFEIYRMLLDVNLCDVI